MHDRVQALEERLRLVRAQRNKLLSAFENLQGSGQCLFPSCVFDVAAAENKISVSCRIVASLYQHMCAKQLCAAACHLCYVGVVFEPKCMGLVCCQSISISKISCCAF